MALKSSLRGGGNGRPLLLILLGSGSNRVIIKFFFSVTRSNPVTPKVEQSLGREKMRCGREMVRGELAARWPRGSGQGRGGRAEGKWAERRVPRLCGVRPGGEGLLQLEGEPGRKGSGQLPLRHAGRWPRMCPLSARVWRHGPGVQLDEAEVAFLPSWHAVDRRRRAFPGLRDGCGLRESIACSTS